MTSCITAYANIIFCEQSLHELGLLAKFTKNLLLTVKEINRYKQTTGITHTNTQTGTI